MLSSNLGNKRFQNVQLRNPILMTLDMPIECLYLWDSSNYSRLQKGREKKERNILSAVE